MRRLEVRSLSMLPVVDADNPTRLLGTVTSEQLRQAYDRGVSRRTRQIMKAAESGIDDEQDMNLIYVDIPTEADADGDVVRGLELPRDCLIVSLERNGRRQVVRGDTTICTGDRVAVVVTPDSAAAVRELLTRATS